jgi:hypothetical protein
LARRTRVRLRNIPAADNSNIQVHQARCCERYDAHGMRHDVEPSIFCADRLLSYAFSRIDSGALR